MLDIINNFRQITLSFFKSYPVLYKIWIIFSYITGIFTCTILIIFLAIEIFNHSFDSKLKITFHEKFLNKQKKMIFLSVLCYIIWIILLILTIFLFYDKIIIFLNKESVLSLLYQFKKVLIVIGLAIIFNLIVNDLDCSMNKKKLSCTKLTKSLISVLKLSIYIYLIFVFTVPLIYVMFIS